MRSLVSSLLLGLITFSVNSGCSIHGAAAAGVKIGVLSDLSGPYAPGSGMGSVEAVRMAAEEFGGSIAGMPIEVIAADMQNKPDVGSAIAKRWLDTEGVDAIIDIPNSAVALAVEEIVRARPNKLFLATSAASSDLVGKFCTPNTIQWTYDTYAQSVGLIHALVKTGFNTWFFMTVDYAFGHSTYRDASVTLQQLGALNLGNVEFPLGTSDFGSYLLTALQAHPQVIAFAMGGNDMTNAIKEAGEFGLASSGARLVAFGLTEFNVRTIGFQTTQGVISLAPFLRNRDDSSRKFAAAFKARVGAFPSYVQAGAYSAARSYFQAVSETGTTSAPVLVARLREMNINDAFTTNGRVRQDGLMVHDMYLVSVNTPERVAIDDNTFKLDAVVPAGEAFRPLSESECPTARK